MEFQKLSQSARYRAEADGLRFEATVTTENNAVRIESGNITDTETGTWLGTFNTNGDFVNYGFSTSDSSRRLAIAQAVETLIAQLKNIE